MNDGKHIEKQEYYRRCDVCASSPEPGWLPLGKGDWLRCPQCSDSSKAGHIHVLLEKHTPTRKIILPTAMGVHHGKV